ncbi:SUN domain-containing protein 1-like [Trichogramma pretiosum]|uniref:SUN domain-containing protein 1-like n=1 Tax=Trichogramma pretiosum TaxID=7493 RepID=UPI0006C9D261|nr:SUN domain-containing protein 1-like [Trichogramma pretiosum]
MRRSSSPKRCCDTSFNRDAAPNRSSSRSRLNTTEQLQHRDSESRFANGLESVRSYASCVPYAIFHCCTLGYFRRTRPAAAKSRFSSAYTTSLLKKRLNEGSLWQKYLRGWSAELVKNLYLMIINVLLLDVWLLSRADKWRRGLLQREKYKLLSALIVVPIAYLSLSFIASAPIVGVEPEPSGFSQQISETAQMLAVLQDLQLRLDNIGEKQSRTKVYLAALKQKLEELPRDKVLNDNFDNENLTSIRAEFQTLKLIFEQLKNHCTAPTNDEIMRRLIDRQMSTYFGESVTRDEVIRLLKRILDSIDRRNDSSLVVGVQDVERISLEELSRYRADKTARVDYAVESSGGEVVSVLPSRCNDAHGRHGFPKAVFTILGIPVHVHDVNNPRLVIQAGPLYVGKCWAFRDFQCRLLLKLWRPVRVTGFSLEHAPRLNLPNGDMSSAPREFSVEGLVSPDDENPENLGDYQFLELDDNLQYFSVKNNTTSSVMHQYVRLQIHSNHGNSDYTCLYRFRVHGDVPNT